MPTIGKGLELNFLEGQGIFAFGGVNGNGGGDAPTIFYSRRIGLQGSTAVPIGFGGRLAGRVGRYSVGALNIGTDEMSPPKAAATNFTVLRVRRDVLQRSSVGALFTNRSVSTVSPGSNQVFGVDANFAMSRDGSVAGYLAKSNTTRRTGDAISYRANFNYAADRYGAQLDRTVVGDNFNPEVGFAAANSMAARADMPRVSAASRPA